MVSEVADVGSVVGRKRMAKKYRVYTAGPDGLLEWDLDKSGIEIPNDVVKKITRAEKNFDRARIELLEAQSILADYRAKQPL